MMVSTINAVDYNLSVLGQRDAAELFIDEGMVPLVDSAEKTISIHLGWLELGIGTLILRTTGSDTSRVVTLQALRHCTLEDVTNELALKDGHPSLEAMKRSFARVDPNILRKPPYEIRVTLVYFSKDDGVPIDLVNTTMRLWASTVSVNICGM
jgi:hypothetical protein